MIYYEKEVLAMSTVQLIGKELKNIPEIYLKEILDFIRFVEAKAIGEKRQTAIASESALKKDWLHPAEDKAWKSL
jgi:hypothetical protein